MTMYKKIKELPENQKTTTVVLLALIEEKETRAGKPYCELTLSDGETQIQAKLSMQSITKDGVVHYITKLEDFQELMPYEVYKGMSSFLQSQLNTMEEEYEDSLSAVRSDLNLLDEKYDELEAEKDNLEVKLVEALEQLEEYKDQFGEL